ncbi:MAG: bifunctional diaminohydroxyphosphoribosylaminopyrimidine deaminase/5-amino-6-(5-phosphoribosylamino)uracil reductase RibD [Bacteroidetes bacterium]|nr:MAG: bifunctional diaminohydroxyphosphoribosylaminopyrimidine deaminase/5-amino-6-(5-phosphoribosylamino)uracil reductase RibD [Bacteroidota bacterium]
MSKDEIFMQRCLELAVLGMASVSPNPMVGCVIVHENQIIGEGYHQKFGQAHAEVNAINSVENKELLTQSTVYVSLEPCAHVGKTPACADLLIKIGVKKVVVACLDPNPLVAGKGIKKLENAGIEVVTKVLEAQAQELNRRFFVRINKNRPYIILKWAETADGFIARSNHSSKWISNSFSRKLVHKWRSEEDAILVGTNTAFYDNPQLNVRNWVGRNPVRVFMDKDLNLNRKMNLLDQSQPTICYNLYEDEELPNLIYAKLSKENFLAEMLTDLVEKRNIQSIIIEGGSNTLRSFLDKKLFDEIRLFRTPITFGKGIDSPRPAGSLFSQEKIFEDILLVYRN